MGETASSGPSAALPSHQRVPESTAGQHDPTGELSGGGGGSAGVVEGMSPAEALTEIETTPATMPATAAERAVAAQDWWASATVFAEIGRELAQQPDTQHALRLLTRIALRRIPTASAASVTVLRR